MIELIIKAAVALIISSYYVLRLKKYIENRKNNNITGDVLIRWESVSIIDKYHIRERFFGGSKLRIKRDAKTHEIKYYWISFIPAIILILFSIKSESMYSFILACLSIFFIVSLLFDRIEKKTRPFKVIVDFFTIILLQTGFIVITSDIISVPEMRISNREIRFSLRNIRLGVDVIIPLIVLSLILIYSLIKKRIISFLICLCAVTSTVLSVGLSETTTSQNYYMICFAGYLYISLIVIQYVYNIRALKKITYIN